MGRRLTHEEALAKLEPIHPTVDFSRFVYTGSKARVDVSCKTCGHEWSPVYEGLQQGKGCPKCAGNTKPTQEGALAKLEPIHPTIDFSRFVYTRALDEVDVSCKTCDYMWSPRYNDLQQGKGCPDCAKGHLVDFNSLTQEEALAKLEPIHPTIDFSRFVYTNNRSSVNVSCKTCDYVWSPRYNDLQKGHGCPKCAGNAKLTQEEALESLEPIHPTIDFSRFVYKASGGRVDVSCKTCGHAWRPTPGSLKTGYGCPKCKSSKGEKRVAEILDERGITYETEHKVAGRLRLDFYIPSLSIGIEVQGDQHYFVNDYFGGMKTFKRQVKNDRRKRQWCRENGVRLISIPYLSGNTDNFERYLRRIHPTREQAHLF